jgi:hypothetical protein
MKLTTLILAAACGAVASFPLAAHHNCAAGDACPDEIGDLMENHTLAIEELTEVDMGGQMDPADVDDPNQDGGGADVLPGMTRPSLPGASNDTQERNWSGR